MPENALKELLLQDISWPVMIAMGGKVKGFVVTKGLLVIVTSAASISFTFGYAAHKFDNAITKIDKFEKRLISVENIQTDVAVMRAEITNIKDLIKGFKNGPDRITK
jgi:hypothetical protein